MSGAASLTPHDFFARALRRSSTLAERPRQPTIVRYRPLPEVVHAFHYGSMFPAISPALWRWRLKMLSELPACATRMALWVELLNRLKPTAMLEVGVWKGDFAANVLRSVPSIGRYYMIDAWRHLDHWNKPLNTTSEDLESAYRDTIRATAFAKDKVEILRGTTAEVIDRIADESIDFAYVDGDHTLRGIAIDLICVYPKIRSNGYLGGDDFVPDIWQHGQSFEPTLVFPFAIYFAEAVGVQVWALDHCQFIMEKTAGKRRFQFHDARGLYSRTELLPLISQQRRTNLLETIARSFGMKKS